MKGHKRTQWIEAGYDLASQNGINSLNIESIARKLDKNKSSFYHYFGDMGIYEAELLEFHVQQVEQFAARLHTCESMRPDVLNVFIERKIDLFFHKQLRINRANPEYKACFEKAFQKVEDAVIPNWADFFGLREQQLFARTFFQLIAENFLLQITEDTFNYQWINQYLEEIQSILKRMSPNPKK